MFDLLWPLKYELALAAIGMGTGIYGLRLEWRERQRVATMAQQCKEPTA